MFDFDLISTSPQIYFISSAVEKALFLFAFLVSVSFDSFIGWSKALTSSKIRPGLSCVSLGF